MANRFRPEIKSLQLIHTAMLVGQVIFLLLVVLLAGKQAARQDIRLFKILQGVVAVTALTCVTAAFLLFRKKITLLQAGDLNLTDKLNAYRAACIGKFALIEGPALFSMIAYFLYPNLSFMLLAAMLLILFSMQRPTLSMLCMDLQAAREDFFE